MYNNYIVIDKSLSESEQFFIKLDTIQTDKILFSKLETITDVDVYSKVYDFNVDDIYPGHYHILKYMLKNGYLTQNVLDFSKCVADITETGGGCMYAMLDVHSQFLNKIKKMYINFDTLEETVFPFLVRCPYLEELKKYKFKVYPYLEELNEYNESKNLIEQPESICSLIYSRVMRRDVPNIVSFVLVLLIIKLV
jgi:hypothetical protein